MDFLLIFFPSRSGDVVQPKREDEAKDNELKAKLLHQRQIFVFPFTENLEILHKHCKVDGGRTASRNPNWRVVRLFVRVGQHLCLLWIDIVFTWAGRFRHSLELAKNSYCQQQLAR